jgi:N-acetylmuramoyl-L-alanine amidase
MNGLFKARRIFLKRLVHYGAGVALLSGAEKSLAASKAALTGIRISQADNDHTRIVFDLSKGIEHNIFALAEPHRIVVDLSDTRASAALVSDEKTTNILKGIRSANRATGELRVVFDLNSKVRPRSFYLQPDGNSGHRLVVDLHSTNLSPTPILTSQQKRRTQKKEFVIALDPGHGGRDPGAIGRGGTREKDVTLAVAKKMKEIINRTPGYRALLTREGDQFIALRNRVKKARERQADLFVSLHADSFRSPKVKGASVYALSLNGATSEAARLIAEKENRSDLIGGINLDDKDDLITSVLLDLSQAATIQDSLELGDDVLKHISKVSSINNDKVQQAGFAVLKAPDVPSILVETAFLSNPTEEKKLRNSKHQQKLARAVFAGIKSHLSQSRS